MLYVWHSCIKAGHFVLYSITEYHMWKIFKVKTRLTYHIAGRFYPNLYCVLSTIVFHSSVTLYHFKRGFNVCKHLNTMCPHARPHFTCWSKVLKLIFFCHLFYNMPVKLSKFFFI